MTLTDLWADLNPKEDSLEKLKKDYARGITPNLPYFIVGQQNVKDEIGSILEAIDGEYFNRKLIYSDYGNGKTNLLKYLELYFDQKPQEQHIHYIYQRANVDQPDIFLTLLKLLEDNLLEELLTACKETDASFFDEQAKKHTNISGYITELKKKPQEELLLMGTGRYYTKNYFNTYSIPQLTDFDRREVFIFLANLLAKNDHYIVFALDELEKIYEKSKARFRSFLTSYRELIDKSNEVKGHVLLTAIVTSATNVDDILLENPAFYSRIKKDMIEVGFLIRNSDKFALVEKIARLLDITISEPKMQDIAAHLKREYGKGLIRSNRYLLADIHYLLSKDSASQEKVYMPLEEILEDFELEDEYEEMYSQLEDEGTFDKIDKRFFDPLQYYLEYRGYTVSKKDIDDPTNKKSILSTNLKQFYVANSKKVFHFILSNKIDQNDEITKIKNLLDQDKLVVAFVPESIDIKFEDFSNEYIEIVNYDPKKLLTLLMIFEEIGFHDDMQKIISEYTRENL